MRVPRYPTFSARSVLHQLRSVRSVRLFRAPRGRPRRARIVGAACAVLLGAVGGMFPLLAQSAIADSAGSLPACPFWTNATPPQRSVTPWVPPLQTAPAVNLTSRLAAPTGVSGTLSGGQVTITLNRVPGAQAYRVWRNSQSVAWITDWGQPTLTAVDTAPCQNAFYSVVALADQNGTDASMGRLSAPYQLSANGVVLPWQTPVGSTIAMTVTSYNDGGLTASGYNAQLGVCAVDPRVIPWGTYFTVPGYGTCYAADIGTWIQNDTVDVWLPGSQANGWGVQSRTVTIIANPYGGGGGTGGSTSSASPSPSTSASASPSTSPSASASASPSPTGGTGSGTNPIANPGFESGALSPWTCDAGTGAVVSTPVHAGSHALAITPTSSDDAQCSQTVAVKPSTTYTLSGWVHGNYAYLGADVPGGTGSSTWTPSASGWSQLSTTFTTGASTSSVTVWVHGWYGLATVDVDDVSLSS
jgi:3D (Asp-Asp-Asp) domain-containing protein